jgi:hypothetical protein
VVVDAMAAAVAGLAAAQCMEVPAYVQRFARKRLLQDVFAENGAIVRAPLWCRRPAGWVIHALAAVLIVLLYATFFAGVGNDHLLWWGLFAGVVHGILGGLVIGAWSDLHPDIPERLRPPGVFYRHYGRRDVITFCIGHVVFGAVAGTVYAVLHRDLPVTAIL